MGQARSRDTIEAMRAAVPPGQPRLGREARRLLAEATRSLQAGHLIPEWSSNGSWPSGSANCACPRMNSRPG